MGVEYKQGPIVAGGWNESTVADGNVFNEEFVNLYNNIEYLKQGIELKDQVLEFGLTAPAAVYFDEKRGKWRRYNPNLNASPAIYIGNGKVALEGSVVDIPYVGHHLCIQPDGTFQGSFSKEQLSRRFSIGEYIGGDKYRIEVKKWNNKVVSYEEKVLASDSENYDNFGCSVSISGNVLAVGTPIKGTNNRGGAYIYRYNGGKWQEEAKFQGAANDSHLGKSVSVSGDVAIVGAPDDGSGAAYIFRYNGNDWVQESKLQSADIVSGDKFGYSVSILGNTAIVGAYEKDLDSMANCGAAYVFQYKDGSWDAGTRFEASDKEAGDSFGCSVSLSSDVAIVGACYEDTGGEKAGAAYIFRYNGSVWNEEAKLQASDIEAYDCFGRSVSICGDSVVVGSNLEDTGGDYAGSAYIFCYNGKTWKEEAKMQASNIGATDQFGYSVSIDGDLVAIGSVLEDSGGSNAGATYVYRLIK